jgi:hypothetical protein
MNQNRSFLLTLLLAVGSGTVIGLLAFGMAGKSAEPVAAPAPVATATAAAPTAPSPSAAEPEPMPPVQYDSPDSGSAPAPSDNPSGRPVLM